MAHSMPLYLVDICPHHRCVLRTYSVWWIPQKFLRILSTLSSHGALLDNQSSSDCSLAVSLCILYIFIFIMYCILNRILRNIGLDDGQVFVDFYDWSNDRYGRVRTQLEYYTFASNTVLRLRRNSTEVGIPRNYLANLTWEEPLFFQSNWRHPDTRYVCGAARKFRLTDGSHEDFVTLTCQWDKTWTPGGSTTCHGTQEFFHQIDFSSKTAFLWLGGLSPPPQPANKFKPSTGLVAKYIQCSQTENLFCKEWKANRIWTKCDFCLRPWNGFWGWLLQRVCGIHLPGFRNQSYQLSMMF